jgi:hypothetical protein
MSAAWSGRGLYWQWIRQPMSWSPCNAILAAFYGPGDRAARLATPPGRRWTVASCRVCNHLTDTSNHQRGKGCWGVACLFKNADLSDVIDYVQQVVTAPQLGA